MDPFRKFGEERDAEIEELEERQRRIQAAREERMRIPEPERMQARRVIRAPGWMVTMADLIALVLTFFVLMFAMSTPNPQTWQSLQESLSDSLRRANPAASLGDQSQRAERPHVTLSLGADLTYLGAVLESKAGETRLLQASTIQREHDRLVVSMPAHLLFSPASTEVEPAARPALATMADILNTVRNEVAIEGHAASVGGDAGVFETNWELSLGRAVSIAAALRDAGFTGEVVPMGRGDGDRMVATADLSGEEQLSRRVDIVIRSTRAVALPGGSVHSVRPPLGRGAQ